MCLGPPMINVPLRRKPFRPRRAAAPYISIHCSRKYMCVFHPFIVHVIALHVDVAAPEADPTMWSKIARMNNGYAREVRSYILGYLS